MSVQIFYELRALRFSGESLGRDEDVYVLCFLSGDSRTYTYSGQRERRWSSPVMGSYDDVIAHQLCWVTSEMNWKNNGASGCLLDHQWLTKVRKALDAATLVVRASLGAGQCVEADELCLTTHRRCAGMTVLEAINTSLQLREQPESFGRSDWDVFRITGPGSN